MVAGATDATLLASRVDRLDVDLSNASVDAADTWVLVGLDSRANLPPGARAEDFGSVDAVPGARADVVVVVRRTDSGTAVLSVPRDVLVSSSGRGPERLALSWLDGPGATVAALCGLGIPAGHLVSVDLGGFAGMVDAAGGLDVDVPMPVRDEPAGLMLTSAGRQHVDGTTALAMVRSRHPEHLVEGRWTPAAVDPDGRAAAAGTVLAALAHQVRGSVERPWRLQAFAWATSGAVAVDRGTSVAELASLARVDLGSVEVLPVGDPAGTSLVRLPTRATTAALRSAGLSCSH